jgi:hypothetical protein
MASPSGGDQQQAISVMVTISKADFAVKHILYGVDPHHGVGGEHGYVCVHVSKMPKYYYVQGLQSDAKGRETDYQCDSARCAVSSWYSWSVGPALADCPRGCLHVRQGWSRGGKPQEISYPYQWSNEHRDVIDR